jgi:AcrR family transcriptional regulator
MAKDFMSKTDFGARPDFATQIDLSSREKLIRSAETLFAAKGFREVSVREIAAHAGVNSALVGYYFRGKQALFNEVYRAHALPLAQERMRRLNAIIKNGRERTIEEILHAWLDPWMRLGENQRESALHLRFTANLSGERWTQTKKAAPFMHRTHAAFVNALQQCLPYLSKETLMWRLHFLVGAIAFGIRVPDPLLANSKGMCDPSNLEDTLAQILPYAAAGFRAHEPGKPLRLIQATDDGK